MTKLAYEGKEYIKSPYDLIGKTITVDTGAKYYSYVAGTYNTDAVMGESGSVLAPDNGKTAWIRGFLYIHNEGYYALSVHPSDLLADGLWFKASYVLSKMGGVIWPSKPRLSYLFNLKAGELV